MKRLSNGRYLKEWQLGPYLEHYCLQRLSPTLDDFHPVKYKDMLLKAIPRLANVMPSLAKFNNVVKGFLVVVVVWRGVMSS
jgi:hypothetical protein